MKIKAYALYEGAVEIRPAPAAREWMSEDDRLSLDLANSNGWELLCPYAFNVVWNGGPNPEDIEIESDAPPAVKFVKSLLGNGILTFYGGYQFKTEGEHSLWVRGPINHPKDAICPLDSILDTSSLPVTVSVHWKLTHPGRVVRFEKSEPFAAVFPYPLNYVERFEGEIIPVTQDIETFEAEIKAVADQVLSFEGQEETG